MTAALTGNIYSGRFAEAELIGPVAERLWPHRAGCLKKVDVTGLA